MGNLSRRSFIKTAAAAGAAFAVPNILTRPLFGAPSANGTVNVAMIGCGGIGTGYHLAHFKQMADVRVVAVADAYKSRREAAAAGVNQHYGEKDIIKAYADFREILARPDVDAVIIGAHDHWHIPMSIAACKAGKDVYCQKPLAVDWDLCQSLRAAFAGSGRIFQFGTQYRSMGNYRLMVELVRNGYIGELKHIDQWCRGVAWDVEQYHVKPYGSAAPAPVPADLDFDMWQGPTPMAPYTVDRCTNWGGYHCPETSLGFIAGCGIHELGIVQWANKSDHTSPITYKGTGFFPTEGIYRTLAKWDVNCEYANGVTMRMMDADTAKETVTKCLGAPPRYDGAIFHGTEGWISVAQGFQSSNQKLWKTEFKSTDERLPVSPEHNRNFIDCVKSRKETMCPVEMAIRADTICHLAIAAVKTGRAIHWDPVREQIIGDPHAARLLSRPYRHQWRIW
jgi:predicted dehydrogenase